ncbi:hypothetical protein BU15DRAFT_61992 [Melanogaster broomeanus]|nr:hypothetical protein BU15DRAFT_61992 [Melanogaster broomeanus]
MSTLVVTGAVDASISPTTHMILSESPPNIPLLPLLQAVLRVSYWLFQLALRWFLLLVTPLYVLWPIIVAVVSPITVVISIMLDVVVLTPFSIIRTIAVALYPLYIFCAVACISGAAVGIVGRYATATILGSFAQTTSFFDTRMPPSPPPIQPALRKRRRKNTGTQIIGMRKAALRPPDPETKAAEQLPLLNNSPLPKSIDRIGVNPMKTTFRFSSYGSGGGIGGLTLALVIGKYSTIPVDVFEAGPQITTVGAGIAFFGTTMDILKELGLYEEFLQVAVVSQENIGPDFRKSDQHDGYYWFTKQLKRGALAFHRNDVIDILLQNLPASCNVQTSKRLEFYDVSTETGRTTLHFSDGSTAVTDVLIGADGLHSTTRKTMYRQLASLLQDDGSRKKLMDCIDPTWTGSLVYRSLVPTVKLLKEYPDFQVPTKLTMHIVAYPVSQGQLLNVVIFSHDPDAFGTLFEGRWVADVSEKEVLDLYQDWEPRVKALVNCVERPSRWALHIVRPLPHYVHGKVALLGDAAHAMETHLGAGAGQAIDDAFILGRLLTHELTHADNVDDALKMYEEVRLPLASRVFQGSQDLGRAYGFHRTSDDGSTPVRGSHEELDYVRRSVENAWELQSESVWVWDDTDARWRAKCLFSAEYDVNMELSRYVAVFLRRPDIGMSRASSSLLGVRFVLVVVTVVLCPSHIMHRVCVMPAPAWLGLSRLKHIVTDTISSQSNPQLLHSFLLQTGVDSGRIKIYPDLSHYTNLHNWAWDHSEVTDSRWFPLSDLWVLKAKPAEQLPPLNNPPLPKSIDILQNSADPMKTTFRVSICGGGIGGLTLALVIGKYSTIPVDVFEAGPRITTVGAGIGLFGTTIDIMKELGLYEEFLQVAIVSQENTGPDFRKSDQHDGYYWFTKHLKRGSLAFHRIDVINTLLQHLPPSCNVQTSKRLEFYDVSTETGRTTLHFSDGSTAVTDVLIGADGIHSATRKTMYRQLASLSQDDGSRKKLMDCIDPVWTGSLVYRNLIPTVELLKAYPDVEAPTKLTVYLGKKKHIVAYPISQGQVLNLVIFCHDPDAFGTPFEGRWVVDVSEEEILGLYQDWEPRAKALVKCVEKPSRWALHTLQPLPHYVHGRVALLGDAAHAMEPHLGAGAGQAIEDAFILGRLLTHELTHAGNVADALKMYEEVRLPFANDFLQRSQDVGRLYGFHRTSDDGSIPVPCSHEELDYVRRSVEDAWELQSESAWVWDDTEAHWRASVSATAGHWNVRGHDMPILSPPPHGIGLQAVQTCLSLTPPHVIHGTVVTVALCLPLHILLCTASATLHHYRGTSAYMVQWLGLSQAFAYHTTF